VDRLQKVAAVLGSSKKVRLATDDDLARSCPDFELGAVPPLGGREDRVIVDERLAHRDSRPARTTGRCGCRHPTSCA
jgi:prolyl-tRNA editing enzyme YbaK/EbsC (Cys-tRNA(Pro) deacylase)